MFNKIFIILRVLILLLIFHASQAQTRINLQQAIDSATKNNLQVQQAILSENNSVLDVLKSKSSLYPNLNVNVSSNLEFGRNLDPTNYLYVNQTTVSSAENIVSTVTLFQGFEKLNQIKQNKLILESSKSAVQKIKNDVTLQVVATYLNILKFKNQLIAAQQQNKFAIQQLDYENKNFNKGKKILADVSRAKFQLSKTEVDIANIQNQINNSTVDLLQLMNASSNLKLDFEEPLDNNIEVLKRSIEDIYSYSSKILPEIKQAEFSKQAAMTQIKIAKGNYYPILTLTGAVATAYSRQLNAPLLFLNSSYPFFRQLNTNLYEYFSVNLSIPIFNNLNNKIALSKAKNAFYSASINEQQVKNAVYKIINQAEGDLETSLKNYTTSQKANESATETFKAISKRYQSGLSSSLDFTQAQNDMNSAQFTLIHDKYDLIFKSKVIDFYLGKPISY